jgi:hypothetical protein
MDLGLSLMTLVHKNNQRMPDFHTHTLSFKDFDFWETMANST